MLRQTLIFSCCLLSFCCDCGPNPVDAVLIDDIQDSVAVNQDTLRIDIESVRDKYKWYVDTLKYYLGAREIGQSNKGPAIDQFFTGCGVPPGNAWCACFANYGLLSIGGNGPKGAAWSPSWFPRSKTVYERDKSDLREKLKPGWVFGLYFRRLGRIAHVGVIVEDFQDGYVLTLEGNTNGVGGREGHGVYIKIRHKTEIYKCSDWL